MFWGLKQFIKMERKERFYETYKDKTLEIILFLLRNELCIISICLSHLFSRAGDHVATLMDRIYGRRITI